MGCDCGYYNSNRKAFLCVPGKGIVCPYVEARKDKKDCANYSEHTE
jgi:hypothetical protein